MKRKTDLGRSERRTGYQLARPAVPPADGARFALFQVDEEKDDYLLCRRYRHGETPAESAATVAVAKPRLLQRTPFDGATIDYGTLQVAYEYLGANRRSATAGDDQETQAITPSYFASDVLRAVYGPTGVVDGEGAGIVWEDTNAGARAWAVEPEEE